ncbi:3-oxoacyl-(acyl-carrier-protein) reductase [Frankia canadensis]|uniref:3-oxoacyl-(Acyl-carrier-protein) reductase n=1 Tax=Frankia canadensis TaxID=1836972 RepID=A0A2I2KMD4_9ACTN|nr:3-oxoacyl-ACP reductase family protein [Frankia canadensis]SNQ46812.1 3-oxoacyl-(acyl-carrier-protein) reductase [Frankia canadensis]SOU54102.1 3-oxoacyl-(acyl-carrier-protein) reductase [Frankia canadensis]
MKGRVAIVTGGTRGIGAAISELLAAQGVHVAAAYAGNHEAAAALRDRVVEAGGSVSVHAGDVGDRGFARALVDEVVAEHGRLDHLVNNAGLLVERKAREMSADEWDLAVRVNLSGPFHLAQAAIAPMEKAGYGRIVNIGSITALMGSPVQVGYGAAKAGLIGMTRSLALAVARKGITVNLVVPGVFETDMTASMDPRIQEAIKARIPVGRRGDPAELAHAVRFLLDERAGFTTGSVVTVDGGLSMGG